jgi:putative CocE/NonD family hydrolase
MEALMLSFYRLLDRETRKRRVACAIAVLFCAGWALTAKAAHDAPQIRLVHTSIPMSDGVKLAATLYMPSDLEPGQRVPALLEYIPYRKDDDHLIEDYDHHSYFARHGFVGVRVDIRGFGNSEGAPPEREYSQTELRDGEQIIAWLARQPWSNGNVGMLGISWGGFNAIQMAMRHPPALKAILATDATEELFLEDTHYIDGIMHFDEYQVGVDLNQGRTGAPDFPIDEETLVKRFDSTPWSLNYLRRQRNGAFWREPVGRLEDIKIPCFLIGGFQDGYRNSILRMLERVPAPVHAWVGPWNHAYPNGSTYGPNVEWRDQAVRWFDHWLKGAQNGVENDPRLLVYQQHSHPPGAQAQDVPGEWRAESWPPAGVKLQPLHLAPNHQLSAASAANGIDKLAYVPSGGTEAGLWWGELLDDQRPADAYALTYETPPLNEDLAILGRVHVKLTASSDAPLAHWFVKLEDVADDGRVTAITGAGINGAQRRSTEQPEALTPGTEYPLDFDLYFTSWVWPAGHRVRVTVSNAQWPMFWPTPYLMTTRLVLGGEKGSVIVLPTVPVHGRTPAPFAAAQALEVPPDVSHKGDSLFAWPGTTKIERDPTKSRSTFTWQGGSGMHFSWGDHDESERLVYEVDDNHPDQSRGEGNIEITQTLKDRKLTWRGHLEQTSDATRFHYTYTRELLKDGVVIRSRTWREDVPRDFQ